jgi:hypothetical protein
MAQRGRILLVDTNIIIECFRTRCWAALCSHFAVETVERCYEEALTGDPLRPGYVEVDSAQLRSTLKQRHAVGDLERAQLALANESAMALDAGERDLFAHALGRGDAWLASCADRAAVNMALALGWGERLVSLEHLARDSGSRVSFKQHFTERWLSEVRTTYLLRLRPRPAGRATRPR